MTSNLAVMTCLSEQIHHLEKVVKAHAKLKPAFEPLLTVSGIGSLEEPSDFRRTDLFMVILHESTGIKVEAGHLSTVALSTDIIG